MVPYPIMHPGECCKIERALWEGWWWMYVLGLAESRVTSLICCDHFLTCSPLYAVHCQKVVFTYCPSWPTPTVCAARCCAPYVYTHTIPLQVWNFLMHTHSLSLSSFVFLHTLSHPHTHMHTQTCSAESHIYCTGFRVFYQKNPVCLSLVSITTVCNTPLRHNKLHCNHITWALGLNPHTQS